MPTIIYSDTEPRMGGRNPVRYDALNATKHWLTHYGNHCFLTFIARTSDNRVERQQASKELLICLRKLSYWERHPNFRLSEASEGKMKLLRDWNLADGQVPHKPHTPPV